MASPTKPNNRFGTYVVKTFKDESSGAYVSAPLPPDPPLRDVLRGRAREQHFSY
jgi:hypothetical protein